MTKQIAITYDVRKRILIGASSDAADTAGFATVHVGEDQGIVVTCEGSFSWRVVNLAAVSEEAPPDPASGKQP